LTVGPAAIVSDLLDRTDDLEFHSLTFSEILPKVTRQTMHFALRRYDEGRRCTPVAQNRGVAVTSSVDVSMDASHNLLQDRNFPAQSP
jgi:hypothetical protein